MHAHFRIGHSRAQNSLNNSQIVKDLERPWLYTLSARTAEGLVCRVNQATVNRSARKFYG